MIQKLKWPGYLQTGWRKNNTDDAGVSMGVEEVNFCLRRNKSPENLVVVRVFIVFITLTLASID